ncbi:MAG: ATP-dependent RNA helicase, partial [Spirochaetaceae bacterium]|nr:ATP-dependent RNA helicase [Spirochaetaceae bacterium]
MNYLDLPVYRHKDLILSALEKNQVIVVESPTGSGKTTQMPVILYEAGYAKRGLIGITQPRRIAALSVSEFIARQMGLSMPGLVGYKMRFEDKTGDDTKIKIMTDGILLQEMKLDPWLSKYDCMVIDEAHERSLTIDFILGLLKRILDYRSEFKVIISSATINAELFSAYFSDCPVVKIDAVAYPVTLIYDPAAPERPEERRREAPGFSGRGAADSRGADSRAAESRGSDDVLLDKICAITGRVIDEGREGDILIFLPGEKLIKSCMQRLASLPLGRRLHLAPLYGRLGKEEQEKVFERAPPGKTKAVIATNIAETSVTIDGVTTVIDSGLSKLNHYNPRTFTASLVEGPISKASANQRRGRAGRTRSGTCYRLYTRRDFENRPLFTTEEIYRTDLSEVVLRMADLGITSYEEFDFISPPGREGLIAAIETLKLLDALEDDLSLSKTGKMMTAFPLLPRQSRIIVEAIRNYPGVIEETIIAAAFLSTQSPYVLPPGEELDARKAHHRFRDSEGDFVSYLKLYRSYKAAPDKAGFCEQYYLDERAMAEIANVCSQLEETVSALGVPLGSGGPVEQYLSSVARGLIQFVCVREDKGGERRGSSPGRSMYRSLTAKGILIHPGSVMFKSDPPFIVAGEIVRTTRMYAMSVSPLSRESLRAISPGLFESVKGGDRARKVRDFTNNVRIGNEVFAIETVKGKKQAVLPWEKLSRVKGMDGGTGPYRGLRGVITLRDTYAILGGEKLSLILALAPALDLDGAPERAWPRKRNFSSGGELSALTKTMPLILAPAPWKTRGGQAGRELGFLSLFTDN